MSHILIASTSSPGLSSPGVPKAFRTTERAMPAEFGAAARIALVTRSQCTNVAVKAVPSLAAKSSSSSSGLGQRAVAASFPTTS